MADRRGLVALLVAVLALASCSIGSVTIGKIETIPTETAQILVPVPDEVDTPEVVIGMGGGELSVDVAEIDALVEGTVLYNVEALKPSVATMGHTVRIEQGDIEGKKIALGNWQDVENDWRLTLGQAPMTLTVNAGAARAELKVLADLNAERIDFNGGAGDFSLEFSGDLRQDMSVTVDAGAAQVTIIVPEGTAAELTFQGALTNIDAEGDWIKTGSTYAHDGEGPKITFLIRMGVGSLDLRNR